MHPSAIPRDPEALLLLDGFVRDLARSLVAAHDADDVAQQSWTVALAGRPEGVADRAWLAGIVRHVAQKLVRHRWRLARRERAVARPEAVPSNETMREREAARREVVEALLALEEPYRATLLLRFLDGLPPRAVAQRMQMPVETVRTRIKRGLVRLRAALLARHSDDQRAFGAALTALAWPAHATVAAGTFGGVLLVAKSKLVAAAVVIAALSLFLWRSFGDGAGGPGEPPQTTGPQVAAAPLAGTLEGATSVPATESVVRAAVADEAGVLDVTVVLEKDRSPVPSVLVHVWPRGADQPIFGEQSARTDSAGRVRFVGLAQGWTIVTSERGGLVQPEITSAGRAEGTIALRSGWVISGVVVDPSGSPVGVAELSCYSWDRPHMAMRAGQTRADGTFAIEWDAGHGYLEARSRQWSASARYQLKRGVSQSLRLVLGPPPGSLTGSVFMLQRPVRNAIVLLGSEFDAGSRENTRSIKRSRPLEDGTYGLDPRPGSFRTDADGRFLAEGLPPGRHTVLARGPGSALWTGTVDIASGEQGNLTIDLLPGVVVTGTVCDAAGEPMWGAQVQDDHWDPLDEAAPRTAKDGSFRLVGLAAGTVRLQADYRDRGRAHAAFEAQPGQHLVWNAVLDPGLTLRGIVVDEGGKPLVGVFLDAAATDSRAWFQLGEVWTGVDGRFEIRGCPDRPLDLTIRGGDSRIPLRHLRAVRAGKDELRIVVRGATRATIRIVGKVVGPDGEPVAGASVVPTRDGSGYAPIESTAADGRFAGGPFPAGDWSLNISSRGLAPFYLPPRAVAANSTWDVGTITLSLPGYLAVVARRADGQPLPDEPSPCLVALDLASGRMWPLSSRGGRFDPLPLPAGSYVLNVRRPGLAHESLPFALQSGETTALSVELRPGVAQAIQFELQADDLSRRIEVTVRDAEQRVVLTERIWRDPEQPTPAWAIALPPGSYVVEAATPARRSGRKSLVVAARGAAVEPLWIELR